MTDELFQIRAARAEDAAQLFGLVESLAEFEGLSDQVAGDATQLKDQLFGSAPAAEAVIAELKSDLAGFAVFFSTFSAFLCRPGLWVEDLFVLPEHRASGVGSAMLAHIAGLALERGCARVEWRALDWNDSALRFYRGVEARVLEGWQTWRMEGDALTRLARRSKS